MTPPNDVVVQYYGILVCLFICGSLWLNCRRSQHCPLTEPWKKSFPWSLWPLHTRDWMPVTLTIQALIGGNRGVGPSSLASHYAWGTNGVSECKTDVKVYMDSYMAWVIFKSHFLEVGLVQNWETMALLMLMSHNRWFILFYHVRGPAWIEIYWNSIWLRAQSHMVLH